MVLISLQRPHGQTAIIATCPYLPPPMPPMPKSATRPPTSEKQRLRRLLDNNAPHETIRSELQPGVNNSNIINSIRTLAVGEQARLLEIIDQVRTLSFK